MRKDEDFWWPHLKAADRARYVDYGAEISRLNQRRKTIRDRAYQRARRASQTKGEG